MNAQTKKVTEFPRKSFYDSETVKSFLELFREFEENHAVQAWFDEARMSAVTSLAMKGLPTPKLERWKYTNLLPVVRDFGTELAVSDIAYKDPDAVVQKLTDVLKDAPKWIQKLLNAKPVSQDRYGDMMLWDLCNAFLRDGLVVDVPDGQICDHPLEIDVRGHNGTFFVPRMAFRLGKNAELTIIERHTGEGRYWNNSLMQIQLGPGARLRHYRIQENPPDAVYTQNTHVQLERDATYDAFVLTAGAGLSRNQITAELQEQNASCTLNGVNMLSGKQHADTTAEIVHVAPHCRSSQFFRSVLDDQAHGVFQGKVRVEKGADDTDGYQLCNALLLSEGAEMDTKPELEIYADDVKCSHGATNGQLDEDALFYLRSRGIGEDQARALLVEAFLGEVVEQISDEAFRNICADKVTQWLCDNPSSL